MALKLIKNKIKATQRTSKVTKAMEAVSAVKMRKSQEKALKGRPYAEAAFRILENVSRGLDVVNHPFMNEGRGDRECFVVITSDKGLAGSLNSAVLKEAHHAISAQSTSNVDLICFGKKAYEYFSRRGYTVAKHYINVSDAITIDDAMDVVAFLTTAFRRGAYKKVFLIHQQFISTFEQNAVRREILPIREHEVRKMIKDIRPRHGKYSETTAEKSKVSYTREESDEKLFDAVLGSIMEIMIYHALLESKASEHSARMVAMKNATDKARDVTRSLTLLFNKERQSVITREVSEITGGIEAMKNT